MNTTINLGVLSLGCSKNRVDTELMLGQLKKRNIAFVSDPEQADIILINTCGFIQAAKEESISAILEMAELKKTAKLKALIVAGCLTQRYQKELADELPEVDAFVGVEGYRSILDALDAVLRGQSFADYRMTGQDAAYRDRILTTPAYSAYVKIAEGCNNRCSYCAIPSIRGPLHSRPQDDIIQEVEALAQKGVTEITLVAQDTTKYGLDLYREPRLSALLSALAPIPGLKWIRTLYCYPENITPELIDTMLAYENIVKYLDIPIQHFDDAILKRMNRKSTGASIRSAVEMIRKKSDAFVLRTTLIAGFPGETEEQFQTMKHMVEELRFDRLGVFAYSPEEGTKAAVLPDQIPDERKEMRRQEIMEIQQSISYESNEKRIGKHFDCLVERQESSGIYVGRTCEQAPEIDGLVYIHTKQTLTPGEFIPIRISGAREYDLIGEMAK